MGWIVNVGFLGKVATVFFALGSSLLGYFDSHEERICQVLSICVGSVFADIVVQIVTQGSKAVEVQTYGGRFLEQAAPKKMIAANVGWVLMEAPSFFVPLMFAMLRWDERTFAWTNKVAVGLFLAHYFHRVFIYGLLHRGSQMPLETALASFLFTTGNGLAQGIALTRLCTVPETPAFYMGCGLFIFGMMVNISSDHILIALRKPNETGKRVYKIPQGGFFRFISAANLWGEIIEWSSFAILTYFCLPSLAFGLETFSMLGCRAVAIHKNYLERFGNAYPPERKALIPFVF